MQSLFRKAITFTLLAFAFNVQAAEHPPYVIKDGKKVSIVEQAILDELDYYDAIVCYPLKDDGTLLDSKIALYIAISFLKEGGIMITSPDYFHFNSNKKLVFPGVSRQHGMTTSLTYFESTTLLVAESLVRYDIPSKGIGNEKRTGWVEELNISKKDLTGTVTTTMHTTSSNYSIAPMDVTCERGIDLDFYKYQMPIL